MICSFKNVKYTVQRGPKIFYKILERNNFYKDFSLAMFMVQF